MLNLNIEGNIADLKRGHFVLDRVDWSTSPLADCMFRTTDGS